MRKSKPIVEEVSFKKSQDEQFLYAWALTKFEYYGTSEYVKMLLREKMQEEEMEENNK